MAPPVNDLAPMDRRRFLQVLEQRGVAAWCTRAVGLGALTSMVSACSGVRYARSTMVGSLLIIDRTELARGSVLVDGPDGELPIYIRQLDADRFRALSTRCTHNGCQVDPADDRFICPCHGSEYAADGAVLAGPAELPLVEYRVIAEAERIVVYPDAPVRRERRS
jgi:Rieske Fe-S protein